MYDHNVKKLKHKKKTSSTGTINVQAITQTENIKDTGRKHFHSADNHNHQPSIANRTPLKNGTVSVTRKRLHVTDS